MEDAYPRAIDSAATVTWFAQCLVPPTLPANRSFSLGIETSRNGLLYYTRARVKE